MKMSKKCYPISVACPAGHKIVVGSTTVCSACPVGSYSTTANSNSCEECAAGLTTYGTGSTSSGDCLKLCKVPGVSLFIDVLTSFMEI